MSTRDKGRSKCWCVTLWSREDVDRIESLPSAPLLVVGEEVCPSSGRIHYHAYVEFAYAVRFSTLHLQFPDAHFEPRKGTRDDAVKYALKDGKVLVNRVPVASPGVNQVKKPGEVEVEVHRRLREGDTIRQVWADHPIYCARNMRMLRSVVRIYELWGHREDAASQDNLSGVEL